MSITTAPTGPDARSLGRLSLLLAVFGVFGHTVAWDLFDGAGFVIGLPLSLAAIAAGLRARNAGSAGLGMATAGIVLAAIELLFMAAWTVAG